MANNGLYSPVPIKSVSASGERVEQVKEIIRIPTIIKPYINITPAQSDYSQEVTVSFTYETIYDAWYSIDGSIFKIFTTPFTIYSLNDDVVIDFTIKTKAGVQLIPVQSHVYNFKPLSLIDETTNANQLTLLDDTQLLLVDTTLSSTSGKIINGTNFNGETITFRLFTRAGVLTYEELPYSTLYPNNAIILNTNTYLYYVTTIEDGVVQSAQLSETNLYHKMIIDNGNLLVTQISNPNTKPYMYLSPPQDILVQRITAVFQYTYIYELWYKINNNTFAKYTTPIPIYDLGNTVDVHYQLRDTDGSVVLPTQTQTFYFTQLRFADGITGDKHVALVENGQLILYALGVGVDLEITSSNRYINDLILLKSYRLLLENGILQHDDSIPYNDQYHQSIIVLNINGTDYHELKILNGIVQITDIADPNTI